MSEATKAIADLVRALTQLEDLDRARASNGLTVCSRCASISTADRLQSHMDTCVYAVLARIGT